MASPVRKEEKTPTCLKTLNSFMNGIDIHRGFGLISSCRNKQTSFYPYFTGQHRRHEEAKVLHRPFFPVFSVSMYRSYMKG